MKKIVVLITMMVIIAGCADLAEYNRKQEELLRDSRQFVQNHSTDQIKEAVAKGQLVIGMNQFEVWAIKGRPHKINKTTGVWGVHEQWEYLAGGYDRMYLYFKNGVLTSWQN